MTREPVFLTGATGFLGMELLARYLERTDCEVFALVRARDDDEAEARLRAAISLVVSDPSDYADRVVAVRGDVSEPGLGISDRRRRAIAREVGEIVHSAASVSFSLPIDESRGINVAGTERILDFAQLCLHSGGLRRLAHVSTAYVAGDHRGIFREDDLELGQSFRNAYELSKFEAERMVRGHMDVLPIQVFRPSIVVGEHTTGWTPTFNVIYWPLRAFSKGAYAAIPARRRAPVDVVPVDFVADAIFELTRRPDGEGETYNLAAGPQAATVAELIGRGSSYFDQRAPVVIPPRLYQRLAHPLLMRTGDARRRAALTRSEVFFPYFAMRVRYDTTRVSERLRGTGITAPPLRDYFDRLLDYAVAAKWGRRGATRIEAVQRAPRPAFALA